ncbi:10925_t:CDS:1, partial [Funneliformis caledonium]
HLEEESLDEESLLEEDEISFENKLIEERNTHKFYSGEYGSYFSNATIFILFI